jgi:general secretion pathway protein I
MKPVRCRRAHGFTLLEVLIALAIVAMSAGALLGTITSSASNVIYLKDKTLAEWVAMNRLTEIRIGQQFPDVGKRTGSAEMGGQRWQWEEEVSELPFQGMFRIDVRARPTGETVDDTRKLDQNTAQTAADTEVSGAATEKLSWTTTVTGVISSSRSQVRTAIAVSFSGNAGAQGGSNNPQNPNSPGTPNAPGVPGGNPPGNPPGTPPVNPPGTPGIKPPANDR